MSRKLPGTIDRTIDDMRRSGDAAKAAVTPEKSRPAKRTPRSPALPPPARMAATVAETVAADEAPSSPAPTPVQIPEPSTAAVPAPAADTADEARLLRRSRGREIVARHATYAAVSELIPLPLVNIASVAGVITHMAGALAELYGVSAPRARTRAIVLGVLGGAAPVGLGAVTFLSLMRIVPGAHLIGLAVTSAAAAAATRSLGAIFLDHFERGGTLCDFKVEEGKAALAKARAAADGKSG